MIIVALPLMLSMGASNEILQSLAIVVLGGLFTSTALTLLVIPAFYAKFGQRLVPKFKVSASEGPKIDTDATAAQSLIK